MLASQREEQRIKRLSLQEFEVSERKRGNSSVTPVESRRRSAGVTSRRRHSRAGADVRGDEERDDDLESVMSDFAPSLRSAYTEVTSLNRRASRDDDVSAAQIGDTKSQTPPPLLEHEAHLAPPTLEMASSSPRSSVLTSPPKITRSVTSSDGAESDVNSTSAKRGADIREGKEQEVATEDRPEEAKGDGSEKEVEEDDSKKESDKKLMKRSADGAQPPTAVEKATEEDEPPPLIARTRRRSAPARNLDDVTKEKPRRVSLRGRVIRTPVRSSSDDETDVSFDDWNEQLRHHAQNAEEPAARRLSAPVGAFR